MKLVFLFLFSCGIAAGLGFATFTATYGPQQRLFLTQISICGTMLQNSIQTSLNQNFGAAALLGRQISYAAAAGSQTPPFFTMPGYQKYVKDIRTMATNIRSMSFFPLLDTSDGTRRLKWEAWAKKNIVRQTLEVDNDNVSIFNALNGTAYKYGVYNQTSSSTAARAGDVVPGGDPRFKNWLFPMWQIAPLQLSNVLAIFLEVHQTLHNR